MDYEDTIEIDIEETEDSSFAEEIAKAFVIGLASTAGTLAAFAVTGLVVEKVQARRARLEALRTQEEPTED